MKRRIFNILACVAIFILIISLTMSCDNSVEDLESSLGLQTSTTTVSNTSEPSTTSTSPNTTTSSKRTTASSTNTSSSTEDTTSTTEKKALSKQLMFPGRYPIAVMINNEAAARPQSGFSNAKIVYQMLIEGRTTRFLLVTDSPSGVIGPVRSARPSFLDLVAQHRAFYSHAGNHKVVVASPVANQIKEMDCLAGYYSLYYRSNHKVPPHNLYTNTETLYNKAKNDYSLYPDNAVPGLSVYSDFVPRDGGEAINNVYYKFSALQESIQYDRSRNVYYKYNGNTILVDEQTGTAPQIGNVIIMHRPHSYMPNGIHRKVNWVTSDKATYLTGGKKYDITWSKNSHSDPIRYYLNGQELVLNPGLTWVVVLDDMAYNTLSFS